MPGNLAAPRVLARAAEQNLRNREPAPRRPAVARSRLFGFFLASRHSSKLIAAIYCARAISSLLPPDSQEWPSHHTRHDHFFARSFSKFFSSLMNSCTSLKSMYTEANRT
jgi:hypothetical protein